MPKKKKNCLSENVSACTGCATCCTETVVPVTDSDLRRFIRGTGKKAPDLVRMYSSKEIEYEDDREGWVKLDDGPRLLGLRKKSGSCHFLDEHNRCRVYSFRAMTCRTFPLQVEYEECGKMSVSHIEGVGCRIESSKAEASSSILADSECEEREDEAYYEKVECWNRHYGAGKKNDFLCYLGFDV